MMQARKINGIDVSYAVVNPKTDDVNVAFNIGSTVKELGEGFDLAANFNYADDDAGVPIGRLIVGSKIAIQDIPKTELRDELYMMSDRSLHIGKAPAGALWAIQGSPPLLKNGRNVVAAGVKRDQTGKDIHTREALRTSVGLTAKRELIILRTYDSVSLDELAAIMASLGCTDSLNGDGGGSSYLWPADKGWGRKLGAALTVKKGVDKPMSKPVLMIDPGHGGTDPGANGNGIIEKEYTLKISLYLFERFKDLGVPVALTRSDNITLEPAKRTELVKDSGAKYCISNHLNAAASTEAAGLEVIHSIHSDGKLAHVFAQAIQDEGQKLRRVFCRDNEVGTDYYFMHRNTGAVATNIIEYGFMTNAEDAARIKANWQRYAEAIVRSFCSFIGHPYSKPKAEEPKEEASGMFKDVPDNHPMKGSIEKAAKSGVLGGVAPGVFGLGQPVTREQLAVILDRLNLLEVKE